MVNNKRGANIIVIGGAPRSGTTLLQNILDSHPDITGGPEFLHLPDIAALRKKLHTSISKEWIDIFCSHEDVNNHIGKLIEECLLPLLNKHGGKFLSEKTPENILVFSELMELLPDAHFIQVIRDPRAIIASMLEVADRARNKGEQPAHFTKDITSAIQYVKKCFDRGFKAANNNDKQMLTVVYENLVNNPEQESRKICDFLGIAWDEAMSNPGDVKHLGEKAITVNSNEIWYDAKMYNSNPHTDSLEKWKKSLSAAQQLAIKKAFSNNKELQDYGYKINTEHLASGERFIGSITVALNRLTNKCLHNRLSKSFYKKLSSAMN